MHFKHYMTALAVVVAGTYLTACGGSASVNEQTKSINLAPTAVIVAQHNIQNGAGVLSLDATTSVDPEKLSLTFQWQVFMPNGSALVLSDANAAIMDVTAEHVGDYKIILTVTDSAGLTQTSETQISVTELVAAAQIVGLKNVKQGQYLSYSAAFSRIDWEDPTFEWQISTKPQGSNAQLEKNRGLYTHFSADKAGAYVLKLTVAGEQNSQVLVTELQINAVAAAGNLAPTARITRDIDYLRPGDILTLSGASSSDFENDTLSYKWEVVAKPESATLAFSDNGAELATFSAQDPGLYKIRLTVADVQASSSIDVDITVLSDNRPPRAIIETDAEFVRPGQTVKLQANATDPDGDALTYFWRMIAKPHDSVAKLNDRTALSVEFTTDKEGDYVVALLASDATHKSFPALKRISVYDNFAPEIIKQEHPAVLAANTEVTLAISATDAEPGLLTFNWNVEVQPEGAKTSLTPQNETTMAFSADTLGEYHIAVSAMDSGGKSSRTAIFIILVQ
ncbi:hypothetical protein [Paraglaciecola sp.]|uniref:PKD domain-containing protein n=1 Tax=Paraglaciecola sp. TaxID=1920173 RepID=UPI0030F3DB15